MGRELGYLDCGTLAGHQPRMPDGKQVHRLQRKVLKARIVGPNGTKQILTQVNLATLEQS